MSLARPADEGFDAATYRVCNPPRRQPTLASRLRFCGRSLYSVNGRARTRQLVGGSREGTRGAGPNPKGLRNSSRDTATLRVANRCFREPSNNAQGAACTKNVAREGRLERTVARERRAHSDSVRRRSKTGAILDDSAPLQRFYDAHFGGVASSEGRDFVGAQEVLITFLDVPAACRIDARDNFWAASEFVARGKVRRAVLTRTGVTFGDEAGVTL